MTLAISITITYISTMKKTLIGALALCLVPSLALAEGYADRVVCYEDKRIVLDKMAFNGFVSKGAYYGFSIRKPSMLDKPDVIIKCPFLLVEKVKDK